MTKERFKELMQPIAQGLFGKQGARRYERPHFPNRALEDMMRDLVEIEPVDWYKYVFSREPLNGKFDDEQRKKWMQQSIACGQEYAEKMKKEYGTDNPETIAKQMGMEVSYPSYPDKTDRVLFAEFREPNKIKIYMDAVRKAKRYLSKPEIQGVFRGQLNVSRVLLAHELFHAVEEKYKKVIFTKTERIRLWSLGFLHNDSQIMILGEIAAMSFAAALTGLTFSPYVLDVFLVYGYSPEEASGLYEEIMGYVGKEPCVPIL